jgi:CPA1 family monovalent cation:H+ antiporter
VCALAISIAAERLLLPPAVLLVAGGAVAAAVWHVGVPFPFGPALLFVFLPPLIFEASWALNIEQARKHIAPIAFLAVPGTLVSAFAVAGIAAVSGALPFGPALLLGSIVAATDPIAVAAVFAKMSVPQSVRAIVSAESIGNDGVSLVLYGIAVAGLQGVATPWYFAALHGTLAIVFACALGAACAIPFWLAFSATDASEYEVAGTVALAYSSYLFANALSLSGIFATASAAITLRLLVRRRAHMQHLRRVGEFWHATGYMTNAIVFLATGLSIVAGRVAHEPLLIFTVIVALLVTRAAISWIAAPRWPSSAFVFFAGVRGALPLALALALPSSLPHRAEIVDGVFAVVIVTLVLQGGVLRGLLRFIVGDGAAVAPRP